MFDDNPTTPVDESADNVAATNTDSPWVDLSQTYTSHSSHQVFLRDYSMVDGRPISTGKLLGGLPAGATYAGSRTAPTASPRGRRSSGRRPRSSACCSSTRT